MRPLVVLRPEPGASATAAAARELGLEPVLMPLFDVQSLEWHGPDQTGFDALLLTSANAVRHAGDRLKDYRGLEAYAVGNATAEAARAAGFSIAAVGDSGVERLLGSIDPELKLLHLCGRDRREPEGASQSIHAIPVYAAAEVPPPENLSSAAGSVVLVHSPRAAERFDSLASDAGLDRSSIAIAVISGDTAAAVGEGWECVEAAEQPNDTALLALATRLCNKPAGWTGAAETQ